MKKEKDKELCSVQIVKGGVRHGFLERSKEGAPGIYEGLSIRVVAMLMRTAVVYSRYCLQRSHLRSSGPSTGGSDSGGLGWKLRQCIYF